MSIFWEFSAKRSYGYDKIYNNSKLSGVKITNEQIQNV
jgi:hypothetical protein